MICITKPQHHPQPPTYAVILTATELANSEIATYLDENSGEFAFFSEIVKGDKREERDITLYKIFIVDETRYHFSILGEIAEQSGFPYEYQTVPVEWVPNLTRFLSPSDPTVDRFLRLIHDDPAAVSELKSYLSSEMNRTIETEHRRPSRKER